MKLFRNKQRKFFCFLLFFTSFVVVAQNNDIEVKYHQQKDTSNADWKKKFDKNEKKDYFLTHTSVGGTAGVNIGTYVYLSISPEMTYHFNKWCGAGVGATYAFSTIMKTQQYSHVFGARVFFESYFFNYVALHLEYQWLNYNVYTNNIFDKSRMSSNNILLGGGFYNIRDRVAYYALLLYVISDKKYPNNILGELEPRIGITIFLK